MVDHGMEWIVYPFQYLSVDCRSLRGLSRLTGVKESSILAEINMGIAWISS